MTKNKTPQSAHEEKDVLVRPQSDRRLLSHVPDMSLKRSNADRRGASERAAKYPGAVPNSSLPEHRGIRYEADILVYVTCEMTKGKRSFYALCTDISTNGMRLNVDEAECVALMKIARSVRLRFKIEPGTMPEGYEMNVRLTATLVNSMPGAEETIDCGMQFTRSLIQYAYKRKGRQVRAIAIGSMLLFVAAILIMRVDSIRYFSFNKLTYLYSIVTASFLLSRYLFGALYKPTKVDESYTPPVTIIIPCFNEEEWIQRTILSCLNQNYPAENLEVIVVDDCSNDNSREKIRELIDKLSEESESYDVKNRLHFIAQEVNKGKREAMARGSKIARHDLVVFVDSDSFLDPYAIINLVQPFQDPKMGGVSGRTDVANSYTNVITKMQSVRYYISFRIMKAAEGYFDAVTCLSGPLACYRKELLLKYCDSWLSQTFLGQRATFGDDRSMTNFILRSHRTGYQDTAVCSTIVPNTQKMFLKQQMRWKRSWLRETSIAAQFMWKKEPMMALSFYIGFLIPIMAPVVVLYNLVYVPLLYGFFPKTFLFGLLAMSMLMSMTQLLLRRSRLWLYGVVYCVYHVLVLMWQMPYAWVTFWKSTWGTRMTPEDIAAQNRRRGIQASP